MPRTRCSCASTSCDDTGDDSRSHTGRLIDGANGGIGNWAEVKAQAATMLGIQLTDMDVFDVPLLATDAYGNFIPGRTASRRS